MNEERRRAELEILREFGDTIGHEALRLQLIGIGFNNTTEKQVLEDINYLEQKGLVKIETINNRRLSITRKFIGMTAHGIDFLEGNTPPIAGVSD